MKQAFTLVELAIVIIIIGLLVAGILAGKELIRQSQLTRINNLVESYRSAITLFADKYKFLPGDMPNATQIWGTESSCPNSGDSGTCNGNGNGKVDFITWTTNNAELFRVWEQLSLGKYIKGSYSGVTNSTIDISQSVLPDVTEPRHDGPGIVSFFYADASVNYNISGHHFVLHGLNPFLASIFPDEMERIDTKYDDGKPGSGLISVPPGSRRPNCATTDDATTAIYTNSYNGSIPTCVPIFWYKN